MQPFKSNLLTATARLCVVVLVLVLALAAWGCASSRVRVKTPLVEQSTKCTTPAERQREGAAALVDETRRAFGATRGTLQTACAMNLEVRENYASCDAPRVVPLFLEDAGKLTRVEAEIWEPDRIAVIAFWISRESNLDRRVGTVLSGIISKLGAPMDVAICSLDGGVTSCAPLGYGVPSLVATSYKWFFENVEVRFLLYNDHDVMTIKYRHPFR